jgi:arylsulfatase A-like enzyme/lipopolysaccharide biosynthesis regulator YciM
MLMMKRSAAMIVAAMVLLAAGVWLLVARPWDSRGVATGGPIIFISIDTLRADRLPAYGSTRTKTPAIDSLVADGVLFENAYAHSPQTLPSHTSILSGELPFEHGVRDNIGFEVKDGQRMLQHALKDAGYATGGFVSAYVLRRQVGIQQGFDHYDDELPAVGPDRPLGLMQRAGIDTLAAAVRWIDSTVSPKFFLFFHIYEPHRPYAPPAHIRNPNKYDGEVEYSDEIVGRLLAHLKSAGRYDDATIVLFSDHGEGLGDHGEDEHGIFVYRETIRVPLIVKLPRSVNGGRRVAAPVQHIDLVPTMLGLVGSGEPRSGGRHGRSLLPVLDGAGELDSAPIYSESLSPRYHFGWSELYAISDDRYRLVRAPRDELYDLQQDPGELNSIAADRPQVHQAMRRVLDDLKRDAAVSAPSAVSAEDRQKLAALGYVGTQTGTLVETDADKLPDPKDRIEVLRKYRRATDLAGVRQFDDAISLFRELLADDPGMTDVWLQLGNIYTRLGRIAEAVAAYKEIVRRNPKDAAGLTAVAGGLLTLGQLDAARAHAELAIEVSPTIAHELLVRIALRRERPDEAREHARRAERADPGSPLPAFVEGAVRHQQGQYGAAVPYFLQAREALDRHTVQMPDVNYYLADSLARLERYDEALKYFGDEIEILPTHVRARAGIAMVHRAAGRNAESERAIAELVREVPTAEGYEVAAQLWSMFGEPARAAELRARVRQGRPR